MPPIQELDVLIAAIEEGVQKRDAGIERVVVVGTLMDTLQSLLDEAVKLARSQGGTWEEIGAALGLTRQAVHQRFAKRL